MVVEVNDVGDIDIVKFNKANVHVANYRSSDGENIRILQKTIERSCVMGMKT